MDAAPTLHLVVGLPAVGKTTLACRLVRETAALRLTPDEWLLPLLGPVDVPGKRDVLEGRFIWVADQALRGGLSVVLDFGFWSAEERYALRDVAERAGAQFRLHYLQLPEGERRARAELRWAQDAASTFAMSAADHDRDSTSFVPPSEAELAVRGPVPDPPPPFGSWGAWASARWPSLPRLDLDQPCAMSTKRE